jgi:polysaccharide pyruvyl transferase WcaK-like protein
MAVCLTPHVIIPGNDDYAVLEEFKSHFSSEPRVILLPNTLNAIQYKGYIARMRFFIGARTHATIAAYSNFVPTLVLGYSIKSKGIAKDLFGYERMVLSIDQIADTALLIAQFDALLREEHELRQALTQRIPEIQALSWSAGDALKRL